MTEDFARLIANQIDLLILRRMLLNADRENHKARKDAVNETYEKLVLTLMQWPL